MLSFPKSKNLSALLEQDLYTLDAFPDAHPTLTFASVIRLGIKAKVVFAFQASLHAIRVGGFDCQHITGDHFRDVIHWLKPSINSEELHSYL